MLLHAAVYLLLLLLCFPVSTDAQHFENDLLNVLMAL
jgi:hypothetical protein